MNDPVPKEIAEQAEMIAEHARREGLDFYPVIFEMLSSEQISQVAAYGGFPTGGGNWDGRDPSAYETVLSGDLDGNDVEVPDVCDLLNEPSRAENACNFITVGPRLTR